PQFSTHTLRHLCLTDLARMGWEVHAIAAFAGHRHTDSTLTYIHLSGRDLAGKLSGGMDHIHAWRIRMLTSAGELAGAARGGHRRRWRHDAVTGAGTGRSIRVATTARWWCDRLRRRPLPVSGRAACAARAVTTGPPESGS